MTFTQQDEFAAYQAVDSGKPIGDVLDEINLQVYTAHGPDIRARGLQKGIFADQRFQYERLLRDLSDLDGFSAIPYRELMFRKPASDERLCTIRHDVDIDIRTAMILAEMEAEYGASSTWFILHTAPYYGFIDNGVFNRHESMLHVYKAIQDLGHEIALHTDALLLYQNHGIDGAAAIETELAWLRSAGIDVVGTVAHNSASVYGAENFAIFKGRPKTFSGESNLDNYCTSDDGKKALLGVLDERELSLTYEANDLFWQGDISVAYAATRGTNLWRWNSESSIGYRRNHNIEHESYFLGHEQLVHNLRARPKGEYICLAVHPVYFGSRHSPTSGPLLALNKQENVVNRELGWETYEPGELVAKAGYHEGQQEFQAFNVANAFGMLSYDQADSNDTDAVQILCFGGTNFSGASCSGPAHFDQLVSTRLEQELSEVVTVLKFAAPGMGIARYFSWYRKAMDTIRPKSVIFGIGVDELQSSLPEYWSEISGYSAKNPIGSYLTCGDDCLVQWVEADVGAALFRASPVLETNVPLITDVAGSTNADGRSLLNRLEAIICFAVNEVKKAGIDVYFVVENCGERGTEKKPKEEIRKTHEAFIRWLNQIALPLGVVVIDPYEEYLAVENPIEILWQSNKEWNYFGHRTAAEKLYDGLKSAYGISDNSQNNSLIQRSVP